MAFSPTLTHESKVIPGVRFTVHRMGFGRRTDLDFKTLQYRQKLRELEAENPPDTPAEKELQEQIAIARRKAAAVPEAEMEGVIAKDLLPLLQKLNTVADVDTKKRRAVLHEEYSMVECRIREEWIKAGLVSIEGGEYDGVTAEQLLESGSPELATEIYTAIASDGRLSGTEAKNSSSPTTSGALVGRETINTTAPNAGERPADGTPLETASSTSPRK